MQPLEANELLNIWDRGADQSLAYRAHLLLLAACPELETTALVQLSIGQRDACLLQLRQWAFGSQLICLVVCPQCGERLEQRLATSDIRVEPPAEQIDILTEEFEGCQVTFRLPCSLDFLKMVDRGSDASNQQWLLNRCLISVVNNGEELDVDSLPPEVVDSVVKRMASADPQAEISMRVACPTCRHEWHALFDIVSFFWREIDTWSRRIMRDVHLLASAYGWSEDTILAMSPRRRQTYIGMLSG